MSERIPIALAKLVRRRAREVCEYCLLPQSSQEAAFHPAAAACLVARPPAGRPYWPWNRPAVIAIRQALVKLGRLSLGTRVE